ncbi:MAG: hypothetical protein HKN29_02405 [Rhodothermales bacterium]|nr:hypothetical protein [Rhodothermales bacterium]
MQSQNLKNHARFVPGYHYVLALVAILTLVGAFVNLFGSTDEGMYSASLIVALSFAVLLAGYYARVFALAVQDRLILLEERLRHQELTGKPLDSRLTMRQVIGLRFASDEEFPALAASAAEKGTSEKEIKAAIKNWRGDYHRV